MEHLGLGSGLRIPAASDTTAHEKAPERGAPGLDSASGILRVIPGGIGLPNLRSSVGHEPRDPHERIVFLDDIDPVGSGLDHLRPVFLMREGDRATGDDEEPFAE